jgi:hypothetical protein
MFCSHLSKPPRTHEIDIVTQFYDAVSLLAWLIMCGWTQMRINQIKVTKELGERENVGL